MKTLKEQIMDLLEKWCDFDEDSGSMYFPSFMILHDPLREVEPYEEFEKELSQALDRYEIEMNKSVPHEKQRIQGTEKQEMDDYYKQGFILKSVVEKVCLMNKTIHLDPRERTKCRCEHIEELNYLHGKRLKTCDACNESNFHHIDIGYNQALKELRDKLLKE